MLRKTRLVSLDTETTGLDLWHGCKPFCVSTLIERPDKEPLSKRWVWHVDPKSRTPLPSREDVREIQEILDTSTVVLHNAKYDIRALSTIGIYLKTWDNLHDTLIASHTLESGVSHKLKDLALRHLDINDEDQTELQKACVSARRIGKKKGWRIAGPNDPHWPAIKKFSKSKGSNNATDGWWSADMWLPRAVALAEKYPTDHPWWTVCGEYCDTDVIRTYYLWLAFKEALEEEGLWEQYTTRLKLLPITYRMEEHGISVHKDRVKKAIDSYAEEAIQMEKNCKRVAENKLDNLNSPKQLQGALYHTLKCPIVKETESSTTENPSYSTDVETLDKVYEKLQKNHPGRYFIRNLIGTRKRNKAIEYLQSYLDFAIDDDSCLWLHPAFNVTGTDTTRFSSMYPNAQNISKKEGLPGAEEISKREGFNLRRVFGPAPGREWYSADYSNIELRIFAYASGDKRLIKAFETGDSVHLVIARELYPKEYIACEKAKESFKKKYESTYYQWVKNGNFSLIYGAGEYKADNTYHLKGAYKRIRKQFPLIDKFMRSKHAEATNKGYVTCIGGYRLQVPHDGPHKAVNYFVQGSAGWYMTLAMIRCDKYLCDLNRHLSSRKDWDRETYSMNMTIHDELDFDFPKKKSNITVIQDLKKLMEESGDDLGIPVPVELDLIADNWATETSLKLSA